MEPSRSRSDGRPAAAGRDAVLVSRSCEVPDVSYRSFLSNRAAPRIHWTAPDGLEIVGAGAAARLTAAGPRRFETLRDRARALFESVDCEGPPEVRPRAFGGLAFHGEHAAGPPWYGFPAAGFVLPRLQLTRTGDGTWLTVSGYGTDVDSADVEDELAAAREELATHPKMQPIGEPPGVRARRRTTTREEWTRQVTAALDRIERGDLSKVVLAQALGVDLETSIEVPDVLERLRRTYPDCYRFLIEPTARAGFFGAPPERLVSLSGRTVETEALAGSVGRGATLEADHELAETLREAEKIGREHRVVVETIRDQLAPLAASVDVGDRSVRRLATIQHLQTPIAAELAADEHVLSIVEALHPTPAVGGLPPDAAWETIRATETFDRGWYAGPVGWFDAEGDGEFAVGIRSAVATDRAATLFAGNGIVADSDPDDEWEEVQLKYRPILDALSRTSE